MRATINEVFEELGREVGSSLIGDPYPLFTERRRETPVRQGEIVGEFGLPAIAASVIGLPEDQAAYDGYNPEETMNARRGIDKAGSPTLM